MENEKNQVIELIRSLPDNSTLDDILDELYFRLQVEKGLKELENNKGISHDDVKKRFGTSRIF